MDIKKMIWENQNKKELKDILNSLKLYKDLTRKLWSRWKELYKKYIENKSSYKVEYFSSIWKETVETEVKKVYLNIFKDPVSISEVKFIKSENIQWWIRVFKDDSMVDISYKKIWEMLKK